ncbi:VanZ family protein [Virgibacillus sp. MSP4-1]|uniref:VanZ family protein n=1 Tax=Virgibacillus sp. MSP4-1 TaxID=2700081 RepID=UPI0003A71AA0|nr:VanZ family protein [Virgibacillus sp. MSP4-1]QHS23304.1 VanZ family protein [Virgibacillus sp. MSP4-1]
MKTWWYWLFPVGWMGIIFFSSSQPYEQQNLKPFFSEYMDFSFLTPIVDQISFVYHHSEISVQALGINGFVEFFIRKGAHFGVFFILVLLFILAFQKSTELPVKWMLATSFLLTVLYAAFDELHQGITPNRTPYIGDVMIDTIGALAGVSIHVMFSDYLRRRKGKKMK